MFTKHKKVMLFFSMATVLILASCSGPEEVEVAASISTKEPVATLKSTNTPAPTDVSTEAPTHTPTAEPTKTPEPTVTPTTEPTVEPLELREIQAIWLEIGQLYADVISRHSQDRKISESLEKLDTLFNEVGYSIPTAIEAVPAGDDQAILAHRVETLKSMEEFAKENHGDRTAGLVGLSFNLFSNYQDYSDDSSTDTIERLYNNIVSDATYARLPSDMFVPLLDAMASKEDALDVAELTLNLYDDLDSYVLSGEGEDPEGGQDYSEMRRFLIYLMMVDNFSIATTAHMFGASEDFVLTEYNEFIRRADFFGIEVPDLFESVESGDSSGGATYLRTYGFDFLPDWIDQWYGDQGLEITRFYAQINAFEFFYEPGIAAINEGFLGNLQESGAEGKVPESFLVSVSEGIDSELSVGEMVTKIELIKLDFRTWVLLGAPSRSGISSDSGTVPAVDYSENLPLASWEFGRAFGIASIGRAVDGNPEIIGRHVAQYEELAQILEIKVPPFDEATDGADYDSVLDYMIPAEFALAEEIEARYGKEAAGFFRIGFYTELSSLLYDPAKTDQSELFVGILVRAATDISDEFFEEIVFPGANPIFTGQDKETAKEQLELMRINIEDYLNQ